MAEIVKQKIHERNKQLTNEERFDLQKCLERGLNLTDTAKYLHCSISTVKKEIDRNKILKLNLKFKNRCGLKKTCKNHNVCGNYRCTHICSDCKATNLNCNDFCKEFTPIPCCKKLKHICGVCNGCSEYADCKLNKYVYMANDAEIKHKINQTDAHKGARISKEEAKKFSEFLKPLITKNLSLATIKSQYPETFVYSIQTVYNWIDDGILPLDNLMLVRKVRYAKRKSSQSSTPNFNRAYLENRFYEDFLTYITNNPMDEVVEMDTVEGPSHKSFIMTLLFRRCNFMLAFKIKDQTSNSIIEVFDQIKENIGAEIFSHYFKVILTDRGKEFSNPIDIEMDKTTKKKLVSVFYCDSRQSQQKGKIEKNHEELRKIFPKGFDWDYINQDQLNLALCHVNSYPRKIFNYKTPFHLFKLYANDLLLALNKSVAIDFDKLNLSPTLIKNK